MTNRQRRVCKPTLQSLKSSSPSPPPSSSSRRLHPSLTPPSPTPRVAVTDVCTQRSETPHSTPHPRPSPPPSLPRSPEWHIWDPFCPLEKHFLWGSYPLRGVRKGAVPVCVCVCVFGEVGGKWRRVKVHGMWRGGGGELWMGGGVTPFKLILRR